MSPVDNDYKCRKKCARGYGYALRRGSKERLWTTPGYDPVLPVSMPAQPGRLYAHMTCRSATRPNATTYALGPFWPCYRRRARFAEVTSRTPPKTRSSLCLSL